MITKINNGFILRNSLFSRQLEVNSDGVRTISVINRRTKLEYWKNQDISDFEFDINAFRISSWSSSETRILDGNVEKKLTHLELLGYDITEEAEKREKLRIHFAINGCDAKLTACYEIYPDLPGTIKHLEIEAGGTELELSKFTTERLHMCPGEYTDIEYYKEQGAHRISAQNFLLNGNDDILQLHNPVLKQGVFIGNGAPGPLRNFLVYPHWGLATSCGYSMSGAEFKKYLSAGEKFVSDKIFLTLYEGEQDCPVAAADIREMIRRDLPECTDNGGVMYCTWLPFLKDINNLLLIELAERAAKLGFRTFVVDDGWFIENYAVDSEKFPNGLEEIADKVHALGMKFGLWFNIGTDYGATNREPGNNVLTSDGKAKPGGDNICQCPASSHRDFITNKLLELAHLYQVDYFKLDFSTICSPYGVIPFGCQSVKHKYHRNGSDSVVEQYNAMFFVRQMLKNELPDLIIDFSFETFGTERPSIAALQFSELHHSSNMNNLCPEQITSFHIRNTIYSYCRQLPPERILGSLICLQNDNDIENLLSAFAGAPLVAGNLMKISETNSENILKLTSSINKIIRSGPMTIIERLHDSTYLEHNMWDGYLRCNTAGYGIAAVFANNYTGAEPLLRFKLLPVNIDQFRLSNIISGREFGVFSRSELINGITLDVFNDQPYAAIKIKPS